MEKLQLFLQHLQENPIYVDQFSCREDVFREFVEPDSDDIVICYAAYETPPYEGDASLIYYSKSQKQYYEVHGAHCSCFGLEGQMKPEEVNLHEFLNRIDNGRMMYYFKIEYNKFIID